MKLGTKCYVGGKEAQYTGEVAGMYTFRLEGNEEVALLPEEAEASVQTSAKAPSKKATTESVDK